MSLIGYSQFSTTFSSTTSQNLAAVLCAHTRTESVLVYPLSLRWLISPFHARNLLFLQLFFKRVTKVSLFSELANFFSENHS